MKKFALDEKKFLKFALLMAGLVMVFSSVSYIIMSYSTPIIPQRNSMSNSIIKKNLNNLNIDNKKVLSAAESIISTENNMQMLPNMSTIYEKNNDVVGWIKINDTVINYPVMQSKNDGEFYLYRNFYKDKDINGSIFIDKHCTLSPRSTNLIFHGHNMNNGSMFGALIKYKSKDFYQNHKQIAFDTLYENQLYEIVSVFISKVYNVTDNVFKYYRFYNANNKEEFDYFFNNIKEMSLYDTNVNAEYGDSFITLSTCENSIKNGRFVVVAKKI